MREVAPPEPTLAVLETTLLQIADLPVQDRARAVDDLCAAHPVHAEQLRRWAHAYAVLTADPVQPPPGPGDVIAGRYRLAEPIGRGGMGVVYRAHDLELDGAEVAVKLVDVARAGHAEVLQRFFDECATLARLRDVAIVTIYDRGRSESGYPFLVMELLQGLPMNSLLRLLHDEDATVAEVEAALGTSNLPERTTLRLLVRWFADLAGCLARVHERGIVHRDLKPSNVFVRTDGQPILLDFGLAWRADTGQLTGSDQMLGTPAYMAPEQVAGKARHEPAVDVWGLTACLYHALCGVPPYVGSAVEILTAMREHDPRPIRARRPDLARDLLAIVDRGLERNPRQRYASMAALERDLRAFLDHRPVAARPIHPVGRLWRRVRRRPARAVAGGALALAILIALVALPLWRDATARQRAARRAELLRTVPALLAIEGDPEQRLVVPLAEHEEHLRTLDALLVLEPADVQTRLLRAALHLDMGRHPQATADLRILQSQHAQPYIAAVAERYAVARDDVRGVHAIDLGNLGVAPTTPAEHFVAGFHALRNRHEDGFDARAESHLAAAVAGMPLAARDQRLIALLARGQVAADAGRSEDARRWYEEAYEEATRLTEIYGGDGTARTLAVRGAALVGLRRYADAVTPLQRSLELRPGRHGPLHNLGIALYRLHDLDGALASFRQAQTVRPQLPNTRLMLAEVLRDQRQFAAAIAEAEAIDEGTGTYRFLKPEAIAKIRVHELTEAFADRRNDELQALATAALTALQVAVERAPDSRRKRLKRWTVLAQALSLGDPEQAAVAVLADLTEDPDNPWVLANLAMLLPRDLRLQESLELLEQQARALADVAPPLREAIAAVHDDATILVQLTRMVRLHAARLAVAAAPGSDRVSRVLARVEADLGLPGRDPRARGR